MALVGLLRLARPPRCRRPALQPRGWPRPRGRPPLPQPRPPAAAGAPFGLPPGTALESRCERRVRERAQRRRLSHRPIRGTRPTSAPMLHAASPPEVARAPPSARATAVSAAEAAAAWSRASAIICLRRLQAVPPGCMPLGGAPPAAQPGSEPPNGPHIERRAARVDCSLRKRCTCPKLITCGLRACGRERCARGAGASPGAGSEPSHKGGACAPAGASGPAGTDSSSFTPPGACVKDSAPLSSVHATSSPGAPPQPTRLRRLVMSLIAAEMGLRACVGASWLL
mmetsp:Transcript_68984/g.191030  ORF Transcript_68984/g.191030 Transcript_68984/m.191030 type:complete len:284 (+) Transcript_68984:237-1088(+)